MQRICLSCGGFLAVRATVYDRKSSHIGFERNISNLECACQFVSESPQGRAEHLLYVDDEHTFGHPTAELIRRLGYGVTYEADPKAALALFEKDPLAYDLVITDLVMPGMTGHEFAQRVLGVRKIPVILLTGTIESKLRDQLLKTCVRTVLTKPVTIHELATEIAFNLRCETSVLRRGGK
jgi:CheY-like chemotaxis protein